MLFVSPFIFWEWYVESESSDVHFATPKKWEKM